MTELGMHELPDPLGPAEILQPMQTKITELGAQFVGPTQDHVLKLMDDLRIGKYDTYDTGDNIYYDGVSNPPAAG